MIGQFKHTMVQDIIHTLYRIFIILYVYKLNTMKILPHICPIFFVQMLLDHF